MIFAFFVDNRNFNEKRKSHSNSSSSMISTRHIQDIIDKLRLQQYRNTTWKNYYTIWKIFNAFYIKLDIKPHSWEDRLTLFIGYLVDQDKQSSTIKSYISAICAVL